MRRHYAAQPAQPVPQEEKPVGGFFDAFFNSAATLGLADEATAFAAAETPEEQEAARRALLEAGDTKFRGVEFGEGENWAAFKQLLGGSLGFLAAPIGAGLAGSAATPLVGLGSFIGTGTAQYTTNNLLRQAQEQQRARDEGRKAEETSVGKAVAAGAAQAGLDAAGGLAFKGVAALFPFMRPLLGQSGSKAAKEAADVLTDAVKKGTLTYAGGVAKGVGKGVAFEVPQEIAQQALERWQAGLSNNPFEDEGAANEFKQAAIGAMVLGGTFGSVSGTLETRKARAEEALQQRTINREDAGEPEYSFTGLFPSLDAEGKPTGESQERTVEVFDIEPDSDGMVLASIDNAAVERVSIDTINNLRGDTKDEVGTRAFPVPKPYSLSGVQGTLNSRLSEVDIDPSTDSDLRKSIRATAQNVAALLQKGDPQAAREWVTARIDELRLAKPKDPDTVQGRGAEKIKKPRGNVAVDNELGNARARLNDPELTNTAAIAGVVRRLEGMGYIDKGSLADVENARKAVPNNAAKGTKALAMKQLAKQQIAAALAVNAQKQRKFNVRPEAILYDRALGVINNYQADYAKWRAGKTGTTKGATVGKAEPSKTSAVRQMFDQMNEAQRQKDIQDFVSREREGTLLERENLDRRINELEDFVAKNAVDIEAERQRQEAEFGDVAEAVTERRRADAFNRILRDDTLTSPEEKFEAMEGVAAQEGFTPPGNAELDAVYAPEQQALEAEISDMSAIMSSQERDALNQEANQLRDANNTLRRKSATQAEKQAAQKTKSTITKRRQERKEEAARAAQAQKDRAAREAQEAEDARQRVSEATLPTRETIEQDQRAPTVEDQQAFLDLMVEEEAAQRAEGERFAEGSPPDRGGPPEPPGPPVPPASPEFPAMRRNRAIRMIFESGIADRVKLIFFDRTQGFERAEREAQRRFDNGEIDAPPPKIAGTARRMSSVAQGKETLLQRDFVMPIEQWFKDNKGITRQMVGMYLWARGAKDRNAKVRNDPAAKGQAWENSGSGLTDTEAEGILREFAQQGVEPQLRQIAALHDKLTQHTLNERIKAGVISKKDAAALRKAEPLFASLRGWAYKGDMSMSFDPRESKKDLGRRHAGRLMGTRKKEFMSAQGRSTMPENPLDNAIADAFVSTQLLEQANVMQQLGKQVLEAKKNGTGVFDGIVRRMETAESKLIENPEENAFVYRAKVDGVEYFIEFENNTTGKLLMKSVSSMRPPDFGLFMSSIAKLSGFIKRKFTTQNPAYVPVAFLRDMQDAVITAEAEQTRRGSPAFGVEGYADAVKSNIRGEAGWPNFKAVGAFIYNVDPESLSPETQADILLLREMLENGGSVGLGAMENVSLIQRENNETTLKLKRFFQQNPIGQTTQKTAKIPYDVWRAIISQVENASYVVDLHMRFATYKAAKESGIGVDGAADLALDSSLDLTKRGTIAPAMDALIFFASPTLNSARKSARLLKSPSGRRAVLKRTMLFGVLATTLSMALAPNDEAGENAYKAIPEFTKATRVIIWYDRNDPEGYAAIPLGFLASFFQYAAGTMTEAFFDAFSGNEPPSAERMTIELLDGLATSIKGIPAAYSPIRSGDELVPGFIKPFYDLEITNQNFFGSPIVNEAYKDAIPPSEAGRDNTHPGWVWFARQVNAMTGGSEITTGWLSKQPEYYRYLADFFGGGPYDIVRDTVNLYQEVSQNTADPDKTLLQRTPILRKFFGSGADYIERSKFYERTQGGLGTFFRMEPSMEAALKAFESRFDSEKRTDPEGITRKWDEFKKDYPLYADSRLIASYRLTKQQLARQGDILEKQLQDVESPEVRADYLRRYGDKVEDITKGFNRAYRQAVERHGAPR
jgi:hypothetical protein